GFPGLQGRTKNIDGRHPAAGEVLEKIETVKTAAVLANLGQPAPDDVHRGLNRDGAGLLDRRVLHDFIPRQRSYTFSIARAPVEEGRPDNFYEVDCHCEDCNNEEQGAL